MEELRSKESVEEAKLLVTNQSGRTIDVLWINYTAKLEKYCTMRPGDQITVNTFRTHPWIFRDCYTGLLMHVDRKEVFWPQASTNQLPIQHVSIHYPMQSLRTLSIWALVIKIRRYKDIGLMEIPHTLRSDVEKIFRDFYTHHVMLSHKRAQRLQRNQWKFVRISVHFDLSTAFHYSSSYML